MSTPLPEPIQHPRIVVEDEYCSSGWRPRFLQGNYSTPRIWTTVRTTALYHICNGQSMIDTFKQNQVAWDVGSGSLYLLWCSPSPLRGPAPWCCGSLLLSYYCTPLPTSLRQRAYPRDHQHLITRFSGCIQTLVN